MLKQNLMIIVFASSIGLMNGSVFASEHAYPQTHAIQNMEGTHLIGGHLMTNEERREHQQKMEARAKERGVPLRQMPPGQEGIMDNNNMPNGQHMH